MFLISRSGDDDSTFFIAMLSAVFGGQVIVNDWFRVQGALQLLKKEGYNEQRALSLSRTIACDVLVILEIATCGWDFLRGKSGPHFPLSWRIPLLVVCLPVMTTTSKKLWFWQNEELLSKKLEEKEKEL